VRSCWQTNPASGGGLSTARSGANKCEQCQQHQPRVQVALTLIADNDSVRAALCRRRLERILAIDAETAQLKRQITDLVAAAGTTLTELHGIGPLVAARFIAEVVDVRRYPDRNAFAAANGTAPLPASSGRTVRHRFNPGGNRQLNRALYTIAITQIRSDTEGRAYYERKRAAGKPNAKLCAA